MFSSDELLGWATDQGTGSAEAVNTYCADSVLRGDMYDVGTWNVQTAPHAITQGMLERKLSKPPRHEAHDGDTYDRATHRGSG